MVRRIEVVVRARAEVGEGPVWCAESGSLLWVDIPRGELHTTLAASGVDSVRRVTESLGAVAPADGGGLVVACGEGFGRLAEGENVTVTDGFLPVGQRMNDAKCDPTGRFVAGSTALDFTPGRGAVHALSPDGRRSVLVDGLTLPNGLDWSPDGRTFYLADTMRHEILAWDVDDGGALRGRRVLTAMPDAMPDGLTVDTDGCLWVAIWGGSRLERISPDGRLVSTVDLPVRQPSSCAFGGPDLRALYVTSARAGLDTRGDDVDGSVLRIDGLGAQGLPVARFGSGRAS